MKFDAFISYSHSSDRFVAKQLQRSLESFAKPLFRDFLESLREAGVVWSNGDGLLEFDDRIRQVENDAKLVLGEQIRHSILQVTHL